MRIFTWLATALLICLVAVACSHHDTPTAEAQQDPAATGGKVHAKREAYTGEVVRRNGEYCFKPLDQGETIQRLTRAADPKEFANDEIKLRKYYSKIIVVKGVLRDNWIATAEIVGQWTRPGESRGSTLVGPEPR